MMKRYDMTDSPTARLIAEAIDASGKTQTEIASEMGYERPNVISMLKNGLMRMPIERIPAFSRATGIDPTLLTRVAMTEYMPETWDVISGPTQAFPEAQINIRGPQPAIERYKRLCQTERRTYFETLERMMDVWEARFDRLIEEQRD
jgi:transcriptional regulator with XRE-family HTH domain